MRLKILFELPEPTTVPWNYRTSLTGVIYRVLALSDEQYSHWLHDEGYKMHSRSYRLFVYSELQPSHYVANREGLHISPWVTWQIASPDNSFIEKFLDGIKKRNHKLDIFGTPFNVVDIVQMEIPTLSGSFSFTTLSPVVVSTYNPKVSRHPIYLGPSEQEFIPALEKNLMAKWKAFRQKAEEDEKLSIRLWEPKSKLFSVFNKEVRAWHFKGQVWGSEVLIRFAYDAGLGEKNSQGFGMIEVGG